MCVDENNDGGDVVEREQKHADRLDDARRVAASSRKHVSVATAALFARVFNLNTVDADQTEHGPEQTE